MDGFYQHRRLNNVVATAASQFQPLCFDNLKGVIDVLRLLQHVAAQQPSAQRSATHAGQVVLEVAVCGFRREAVYGVRAAEVRDYTDRLKPQPSPTARR